MALIKCNECGKEISDKASTCPNCGINFVKEKSKEKKEQIKKNLKKKLPLAKKSIIIVISIIAIVAIISLISSISKMIKINELKENFVEETYYCRKHNGSYLHQAELNSVDFTSVKVHIEKNHNDTSKSPDSLKEFLDKTCDSLKYAYKENQIDYKYNCGDKQDTINYTYVGTMNDALKQLEDDGFNCYTIEKSNDLLNKVKNKNWCNYRRNKFYFTFDEMAIQSFGSLTREYEFSMKDNTITIHADSYDTKYTYDEEKNILIEDSVFSDYLFECETPELTDSLVRVNYYYDGKKNTIMPKSGFYNEDEYKFNRAECNNGITATFDEDRKMLFASENKQAECNVYFDNLKN